MTTQLNPAVCAIILNYFGSERTRHCLESLRGQSITRVLIADNSADSDANEQLWQVVEECRLTCTFAIELLVNESNLGFAAGMNKALFWLESNMPHDYYLLLNNDAQAEQGMVKLLLNYLQTHNQTVMVAPTINTDARILAGFWYQRSTGLMFAGSVIGGFHYLPGCCLVIRGSLARQPLFDEEFFMYGEDVALCWRLSMEGRHVAVVPEARVKHEGVASSRQGGFFYEFHTIRGHKLLARKMATQCWQGSYFTAVRWFTLGLRALLRSWRYRSLIPLRALFACMRNQQPPLDAAPRPCSCDINCQT